MEEQPEKKDSKLGLFLTKESLERVGHGFASQQFVNVLFYLSGAGIFLIGMINSLKAALSLMSNLIAYELDKMGKLSKKAISYSGIFFGFAFLMMAFGKLADSKLVFSTALIASGISLAVYGDYSQQLFKSGIRKEVLEKAAKYGLLLTAFSLFTAAFLLDEFTESETYSVDMFGGTAFIKLPGYLIVFMASALCFIISGYFLSRFDMRAPEHEDFSFRMMWAKLKEKSHEIFKPKYLLMLSIFNVLVGIVQVIGSSYYGIYIFQNFTGDDFGGFMNIAVVFLIGIFSSIIGYYIAKINSSKYKPEIVLLISGILLSLMPFFYYYFDTLQMLTAGTIFGVIGASALGISTGMIVIENIDEENRMYYYLITGFCSIIPYLAIGALLSYLGALAGLKFLFLLLSLITFIATLIVSFFGLVNRQ